MSQLPVIALNQRVPPSRRPGGQEMVWQANVQPSRLLPEDRGRGSDVSKNSDTLHLVPESEREGFNEDGISRKLAWLARHGYTVHTYEELLSARVPAPQVSRKERRHYLLERNKVIKENARFARQAAESMARHPSTSPAMVATPHSAYSRSSSEAESPAPATPGYYNTPESIHSAPSPYSTGRQSRYASQASMSPPCMVAPSQATYEDPNTRIDASSWTDSPLFPVDPAFSPNAAPQADLYMRGEVNGLFAHDEDATYGFVHLDHQHYVGGQSDQWHSPDGSHDHSYMSPEYTHTGQASYRAGMAVPESSVYPSTPGGSSYSSTYHRW